LSFLANRLLNSAKFTKGSPNTDAEAVAREADFDAVTPELAAQLLTWFKAEGHYDRLVA
jgi:hypothetical protein